jgi:hypothetical protein
LSDKGAEQDGGLSPDASQPYSIPTICNVTYVGLGADAAYTIKPRNTALHFRDNGGGRYYNSVFMDFGGAGVLIEQEGGGAAVNSAQRFATPYTNYSPNAGAPFYPGPNAGNQLEIKDSLWFQTAAGWPNISPTAAADVQTAGGASVASVGDLVFGAGNNNTVLAASPITSLTRVAGPANRPHIITSIDPRPGAGSPALTGGVPCPADGFFTPVEFRGAFSGANNWLLGWTLMDRINLTPDITNPNAPGSTPFAFLGSVDVPTEVGVIYTIEASSNQIDWAPIGVLVGDGTTQLFVDDRALVARQFYRAVVQ